MFKIVLKDGKSKVASIKDSNVDRALERLERIVKKKYRGDGHC
jgi:hypothetical protein